MYYIRKKITTLNIMTLMHRLSALSMQVLDTRHSTNNIIHKSTQIILFSSAPVHLHLIIVKIIAVIFYDNKLRFFPQLLSKANILPIRLSSNF